VIFGLSQKRKLRGKLYNHGSSKYVNSLVIDSIGRIHALAKGDLWNPPDQISNDLIRKKEVEKPTSFYGFKILTNAWRALKRNRKNSTTIHPSQ